MNPFKVERFLFTDVSFLANLCWSLMTILVLWSSQRQGGLLSEVSAEGLFVFEGAVGLVY